MKNLPKIHPEYGGVLTYLKDLEIGDTFYVNNGGWEGEVIEENGVKVLRAYEIFSSDVVHKYPIKEDDYLWITKQ